MDPDDKSISLLDNNSSFVVIQKMSAENQKQIELTDNLIKNSVFDAITDKFSIENITKNHLSAEEIEKSVQELLKENTKLKEMLQQNSTNMKQQWGVIEKWLEERRNISRSYKRKLDEMNDLILKLKTENTELKKPVQEIIRSVENRLINEKSKLMSENHLLKEKLTSAQLTMNKLEQRLTASVEKEKELIQIVTNVTKQLEGSERARRKLALEVDRFAVLDTKLQRILSPGDPKNVTNNLFWHAIFPAALSYAPCEAQLLENLKIFEESLNVSEKIAGSESSQSEESNASSWICLNKDEEGNAEKLKQEVNELRKSYLREQITSASRMKIIDNARLKFRDIYKQFAAILKEHEVKMKAMEIENIKTKERMKEMEHLKHELSDKQNRIVQLETDYCYLQKRCEESEKKNEDLYFLQSQVKVYEEDFISEREAKETLVSEKQILEHNINCLKQKNKELLKQLQISNDEGSVNPTCDKCNEPVTKKYICFNDTCSKVFASAEELQTHVYSCLNIQD